MNPRDHTLALYRAAFAMLAAAWFAAMSALGEREYRRAYPEQVSRHAGAGAQDPAGWSR